MRTPQTLVRLLLAARRPGESRNAQAIRMGFSEGTLRLYERGGLPNRNTIPALARALRISEAKIRQAVERQEAEAHEPKDSPATVDPQVGIDEVVS